MLDRQTADLLVLAVTLSMMLGPLLLIAYEAVARRWLTAGDGAPSTPSTSTTSR